jgi:hypothetical protein
MVKPRHHLFRLDSLPKLQGGLEQGLPVIE